MKLDANLIHMTQRRKTALITAGVVIFTLFIGFQFIHRTNINTARRIKKDMQEQKNINSLMLQTDSFCRTVNRCLSRVAEAPDPNWLLESINRLAKKNDINITSIDPGRADVQGDYTYLKCKFSAQAPYKKLVLFIDEVERSGRIMKIDSFSMQPVIEKWPQGASAGNRQIAARNEYDVFKRSKKDGVYINARFEVSSFYTR